MSPLSSNPALHALVFDSGVGGLSVSADMRALMPGLRQSYLADDAFRPYGDKSEAALRARLPGLLRPICDMLQPDILVVACNTASTTALPAIRAALDIPVVGVVPAIKPAAARSETKVIGVLGTPGTVARDYVDDLIADHAPDCTVRLVGSVALVEVAEAKLAGQPVDRDRIAEEIAPLFRPGADIDTVVLACTHFPLLRDELRALSPDGVDWIDSGEAIARRVRSLLDSAGPRGCPPSHTTAFLTGEGIDRARQSAFASYGFERVVSLVHE